MITLNKFRLNKVMRNAIRVILTPYYLITQHRLLSYDLRLLYTRFKHNALCYVTPEEHHRILYLDNGDMTMQCLLCCDRCKYFVIIKE